METLPASQVSQSSQEQQIPQQQARKPKTPKPRNLRHYTTKEGTEKRIAVTAKLIARGYYDVDIITLVVEWIRQNEKDRWSNPAEVSRKTVRCLLTRARESLRNQVGIPKEEWKDRGLATCLEVIQSKTASHRDRLLAQKILNDMLGLDAPKYIHQKVDASLGVTVQEIFSNPLVAAGARVIEQEMLTKDGAHNGAHTPADRNGGSLPS